MIHHLYVCVLGYISNAQGVKVIIGANSLRVKLRRRIAKQSYGGNQKNNKSTLPFRDTG
jgi:hypothetical protein